MTRGDASGGAAGRGGAGGGGVGGGDAGGSDAGGVFAGGVVLERGGFRVEKPSISIERFAKKGVQV